MAIGWPFHAMRSSCITGRLSPDAALAADMNSGGGFSAGALRCVITSTTPGARSASAVSSVAMRPLAIVLYANAANTMPSIRNSAANGALPETFCGPSRRDTSWPMRPGEAISGSGVPPGISRSGACSTTFSIAAIAAPCTFSTAVLRMFMPTLPSVRRARPRPCVARVRP